MSILYEIFHHEYIPIEPQEEMPLDLYNMQQAFYNEVEKAMGEEFIAKHWSNLGDVQAFRDYINFREGFRLGISLMLERQTCPENGAPEQPRPMGRSPGRGV